MRAKQWLALCSLVVIGLGCGGGSADVTKYVTVSGVVTLDDKPIEGATVAFAPKKTGQMSLGLTGPDGKFSLKAASGQSGAAVGDHDVTVSLTANANPSGKPASADDLAPPNAAETADSGVAPVPVKYVIPEKYSKKGALSANVPDGGLSDHKLQLVTK